MAKANVKKGETVVLAGTRKGLFVLHSKDRKRWSTEGPFFEGTNILHASLDPRDGRTIWAGVTTSHWGATIQRSTNWGGKWTRATTNPKFPEGSGLSVERIWQVRAGEGDVTWAGAEPAGLFRSADGGDTWSSVDGLNRFPGREKWEPGNGGLCLHSILPYPGDPKRMVIGISAVGVFGTHDNGASWRLMNGGVLSATAPQEEGAPRPEDQLGVCVHKMVRDAKDPRMLYQQNHKGVYRRRRGEDSWTTIETGLPGPFGFPMAAHPHDASTVYTVPLTGDFNRVTPKGALAVYRTTNGGKRWVKLTKGLPQKNAYFTILRDAVRTDTDDPAGVYVGTTGGHLFASRNDGDSWSTIAEFLPPILSVETGIAVG